MAVGCEAFSDPPLVIGTAYPDVAACAEARRSLAGQSPPANGGEGHSHVVGELLQGEVVLHERE